MVKRKKKKSDILGVNYNSEENTLLLYMQEINRFPLLSKTEEEKLAKLVAKGDKAAREKIVNSNLRFVIMVAKKYQGKGLPLEDLISEGNIGLLKAVEHFDPKKGYRLITYAVWWIRQTIIKAIHEKGRMIRLPCNKSSDLTKIEKTRETFQNESGWKQESQTQKIAMFLDMSTEKTTQLLRMNQEVLSLDEPVSYEGYPLTIKDFIEDEYRNSPVEVAANSILKEELEAGLDNLEERAAEVIRCRYGLGDSGPLTLKEVSLRYNLSRERVRQIEKRALGQLLHSVNSNKLESYIA